MELDAVSEGPLESSVVNGSSNGEGLLRLASSVSDEVGDQVMPLD
jgi:hypothetical protein